MTGAWGFLRKAFRIFFMSAAVSSSARRARDPDDGADESKSKVQKTSGRGSVACNKLPNRFGDGPKTWHVIPSASYKNINVCSSSTGIWRQLSPMLLGPIHFDESVFVQADDFVTETTEARTAMCLENLWQNAKVWADELGADGMPNDAWWRRRN